MQGFRQNALARASGLFAVLACVTLLQAATSLWPQTVPHLPSPLLLAVIYCAYAAGRWAALASVAIVVSYALVAWSVPAQLFTYAYEDSVRIFSLATASIVAALLVGYLRELNDRRFEMLSSELARRVRTEEAVAKSEAERSALLHSMQRVMDNSVDIICTIDAQGCFSNISRACERILGYKPSEMIGKPFIDFVQPEDRSKTLEAATGITQGWQTTDFENCYLRKDGTSAHLMWSATWSSADQLMYGIGRDVTERKKLIEEKERADALIRSLERLLPMCAWCHKIRDEHGHWESVDTYMESRLETSVTHSICPECAQKKRIDD